MILAVQRAWFFRADFEKQFAWYVDIQEKPKEIIVITVYAFYF